MITEIPNFENKSELFSWLRLNEKKLISEKMKFKTEGEVTKSSTSVIMVIDSEKSSDSSLDKDEIQVKAIINTTNLMDNHLDVHFPNLWDKSLSENKYMYHLQEHRKSFDSVIAEGSSVNAYTKTFSWKELGMPYEGTTQALVFDSTIKQSDNPMMFDRYKNGKVRQHSVGMQYVKMSMAVNSNEKGDEKYKANWDKYYPQIANKEIADKYGFFFAVTEAKVNEGSAVMFGSNFATPTLETKEHEAADSTSNNIEPTIVTPSTFYQLILKNIK